MLQHWRAPLLSGLNIPQPSAPENSRNRANRVGQIICSCQKGECGLHLKGAPGGDTLRVDTKEQAANMTPADRLSRLRVAVKHLEDMWAIVLQRLTYLKAINESDELHEVLNQTRVAHVHNALHDVLLGDLLLQIGALVLDRNAKSASVASAVGELKDAAVFRALQESYRFQANILPRMLNEEELSPEVRESIASRIQQEVVKRRLAECDSIPPSLSEIEGSLLASTVGRRIWDARKKAIAHYDIKRDGTDWKLWQVRDVSVTYAELLDYIEACTRAISALARFVGRGVYDFKTASSTAEAYVAEYIRALTLGMRQLREGSPPHL